MWCEFAENYRNRIFCLFLYSYLCIIRCVIRLERRFADSDVSGVTEGSFILEMQEEWLSRLYIRTNIYTTSDREPRSYYILQRAKKLPTKKRMPALGIEPRSIPPQGSILPLKYASRLNPLIFMNKVLTPRVELGAGSYQDPVLTVRLCELV